MARAPSEFGFPDLNRVNAATKIGIRLLSQRSCRVLVHASDLVAEYAEQAPDTSPTSPVPICMKQPVNNFKVNRRRASCSKANAGNCTISARNDSSHVFEVNQGPSFAVTHRGLSRRAIREKGKALNRNGLGRQSDAYRSATQHGPAPPIARCSTSAGRWVKFSGRSRAAKVSRPGLDNCSFCDGRLDDLLSLSEL
jgi:hypothetical protein